MATTVVKSIGATGRDYATIQAFFDAVPDLVAADQIWEGQIYPDSGNTISGNFSVTKTTDATRFIRLRPAAGYSFSDNASVRTNALRINASNGILLTPSTTNPIITHNCYIELQGLQLENTTTAHTCFGNGGRITFDRCIARAPSSSVWVGVTSTGHVYTKNSVFIIGYLYTEGTINASVFDSSTFIGNPSGAMIAMVYNPAPEIRNCAFFGSTTPITAPSFNGSPNGNNCAASATTLPVGGLTSQVSADQLESFATDSTADIRLKAGNTIGAAGVYNASVLTDISGTTRDTSTPSVGAWEYVASGATASFDTILDPAAFSGTASVSPAASLSISTADAIFSGSASVSSDGVLTLPVLKNNTGTVLASETGATVHVYATTGAHVVTKTGQTTNGSGVMSITDPLIVASTQYRVVIVLASGAEGMDKVTAA